MFGEDGMLRYSTLQAPYDVATLFPELSKCAAEAIRLHPQPCADIPVNASKIGGDILWPIQEKWPESFEPQLPAVNFARGKREEFVQQNAELIPIMQIRRADLPQLQFPESKDIFQLLWNPRMHRDYKNAPFIRIYWRTQSAVTKIQRSPLPKVAYEEYVPRPCLIHPEKVIEYPSTLAMPEELRERIYAWERESGNYQYLLSTAPGCKVGGHPPWHQYEEEMRCACGRSMDFLLSIDGYEYDDGTEPRWRPIVTNSAGAPKNGNPEYRPTGMNMGRDGVLYVFICRACETWPIKWTLQ